VLLLGFEVWMLGIGLFGARVSPAYRNFYINQTIAEWPGEPAQKAELTSR
jgi:hypothetical protein